MHPVLKRDWTQWHNTVLRTGGGEDGRPRGNEFGAFIDMDVFLGIIFLFKWGYYQLLHHFQVTFCLGTKTSLSTKPFIWKWVPPAGSFSCKSNTFWYERFCTKIRFETEVPDNLEMTDWLIPLVLSDQHHVIAGIQGRNSSSFFHFLWLSYRYLSPSKD